MVTSRKSYVARMLQKLEEKPAGSGAEHTQVREHERVPTFSIPNSEVSKIYRILLAAGGTGGHFFPAQALAENLRSNKAVEVHIATDNRCKKYFLQEETNLRFHIIDLYINFSGILNKIKLPFLILQALLKAFLLLFKLKPSVIVGFGGYPSLPVMLAGQLCRIPTIIYEQNSFFGKTNRIFAKRARFITLAYPNTKNFPKAYLEKSEVIGDVIRPNIRNLPQKRKNDFDEKPFNLLVIGGSQGARFFANLVPEAIKILMAKYPNTKIIIRQQVQKADHDFVKRTYDELGITSRVAEFFHDIHNCYAKSHLVISRSGATTIAELAQTGLPAIFIPLPSAADDHQYHNAMALEKMSASWSFRQSEISPLILAQQLHKLINDPSLIYQASLNLLKRKTDGTKHLTDTVLKIIT